MFRYCVEHGHLCVMRLKEGINLSKKCNGDMISILQGTSKEGTSDVPIRVLEIPLDDGTKEFEHSRVRPQCWKLSVNLNELYLYTLKYVL